MEEQPKKNGVTTDDVMNFLVEHMATKEELQYEIGKLRSDMIDHMDKKTLQIEASLGIVMRAEDRKVSALIDLLKHKNILSAQEAGMILKMEPFPIA